MTGRRWVPASVLAAAAIGLMTLPAVLGQQPGGPPGGQGRDPIEIYRMAGADESQLGQIRQAAKEFEDAARVRAQQLMTHMRDMRQLSLQTDPDPNTVLAKQEEINKVQSEMANERIKLMLKIRSMLRPDQKQRLVQMMQRGPGGAVGQATPNGGASGVQP